MAENGIFLDILTRLNLASVERVLKDVNSAMREGGKSSSRAFSEGFTLDGAKAQFGGLVDASSAAFRDMQRGLMDLQVQEARINDMRANNYKRTSEAMIAAQRDFDAALANSMKLMEASAARQSEIAASRAVVAPTRRGREDAEEPGRGRRASLIPLPRGARIAGAGAAIGLAGGAYEGGRVAMDVQGSLTQMQAQQHDTTDNIRMLTQSVWDLARMSGTKPKEIAGAYGNVERATNYVTGQGYRGQDAIDVMRNSLQLSKVVPGLGLDEAIQAITTTSHDYRIKLENATALLAAGSAQVKGGMNDLANSLHSIEPIAQQAGIQPGEIIAALEQMSQTGQTSQQSAPNLANLIKNLARPQGTTSKAMGQLGLDPEDISTNFAQRGLAGTLDVIQQAILKKQGPDGNVNLGYAYQNALETQQQQEDFEHLSPQLQALVKTPRFQKSEISGNPMALKKAFDKAGIEASDDDVPIVADWLKKQKDLHGPDSKIRSNRPEIENILGAYSDVAGGQEAGRSMMMLAGSPQLLQQYRGREHELEQQGTPNAFMESFKTAMDSDANKFKKLGASAEALAGKMGEHLLPILSQAADDLNGFVDFLDRNKVAMDAFTAGLALLGGGYVFTKLVNGISSLSEAMGITKRALDPIGNFVSNRLPTQTIASEGSVGGAAAKMDAAATKMDAAASKMDAAGTKQETAAAESAEAAGVGGVGGRPGLRSGLALAGMLGSSMLPEETPGFPGGPTGQGIANGAAMASWMLGPEVGAPVTITIGTAEIVAGMVNAPGFMSPYQAGEGPYSVHDYYPQGTREHQAQMQNAPPGQIDHPGSLGGLLGNGEGGGGTPVGGTSGGGGPSNWYHGITGNARGGIVGYDKGTDKVTDPYSQPLLGQPDMKRDSLLGMLPNGQPIGLRGGEGILTPEAVAKLGGKHAIDSLNNPWADPMKVGTKFFGSFSQGVAKYSPFGKYLVGASHSLDDMQKAFDQSTNEHEIGGKGKVDPLQHLINMGFDPSKLSPETTQALLGKYHTGKGAGPFPGGGWPEGPSGAPRDKGGIEAAVKKAYLEAGFDPSQWHDLEHIVSHESGWNPTAKNPKSGAYGLGQFLGHEGDKYGAMGAYSGDPYHEASAMMAYIRDRYGDPGKAWQFWQGHNWYSKGGVVGFADGGVTPGDPGDVGRVDSDDPNPPEWWSKGMGQIPIQNAWMNDPDAPPQLPWVNPSRLRGKGGIGGYSTGGVVGFDGGGLLPLTPPTPTPTPTPTPGQGSPGWMPNNWAPGSGPGAPGHQTPGDIQDQARDQGLTPPTDDSGPPPGAKPGTKPEAPKPQVAQPKSVVPGQGGPDPDLSPPGGKAGEFPHSDNRKIEDNPSRAGGEGNTSKGFGISGGVIGAAEGAAASAANAFAPGSGEGAQMMFALANRAIGYAGQLVGIGMSGLLETFLPNDSKKADPTKSLFGKIATGIAGAHPTPENMAGMGSAMQLKPKEDLDAGAAAGKQVMPMVHVENQTIHHNGPGDTHKEMQSGINQALFGAGSLGG